MSQRFKAVFAAIFVLATGLLALAAEAQQAANPRIALVIGNATYRDAALATTANDAGLVAQTLQAAGFDVVGARDLDGQSMRTAFRDFLQKASAAGPDMQAFVYLAGRAVQYNGDNYFVPVDAQINRDADVPIEAIRISDFTHALAATPGRARIIVLDAARANPYAAQGSPLAPGLALVDPEAGELIAFNAAPGTLAGDEEGPYGVYGKTLAGAIRQGGVDIAQAFDQTRVSVNSETQGALLPWSASKLDGPFYVFERAADAPPPALSFAQTERRPISSFSAEDAYAAAVERDTMKGYREFLAAYPNSDQARRVRAILAVRRESAYWRRTVEADTPRAYWTYLHTYPKGPHIPDARRRLAMLSAGFEPPPDFRPEAFADLPPPPPDELVYDERPIYAFDDFGPPPPPPPVQYGYVEDDDWRDLPPPPPPAEIGVLPVLGVAIPIAIGAVAYQHGFHRNGIAPRGQPRLGRTAFAPPPLPATIRPVAPPAPVAAAGPAANAAVVKPLRPIGGRRGQPSGQPTPGAAPQGRPAGAPPAGAQIPPANPAAPAAPGQAMKPLPVPPAAGNPPVAPPPSAGAKPAPGARAPGEANAPAIHAAPGGKPLPVPGAPPAAAVAPVAPTARGGKPLPGAAGGKALPAPGALPATATAPVAPIAPGRKPLPGVAGGKPLPVPGVPPAAALPVAPGAKPAPAAVVPPAAIRAPAPVQALKPASPRPAINPAPKPNVGAQPPGAVPHAPAPPLPAVHAPAAAAAPRPAPAAVHVPPAMAAPAPRLAPPPVLHAPPPAPVVHAPPPAAALPPALRQPPPVVRVPPPAAQPRACGRPGLPPCPK
ncbi:MAG TPA: caspase family protein [Roseiarcus sp.]